MYYTTIQHKTIQRTGLHNCICVVKQQQKERTSELLSHCCCQTGGLTSGWRVHIFLKGGELIIGAKTVPQKIFLYELNILWLKNNGVRDFSFMRAT